MKAVTQTAVQSKSANQAVTGVLQRKCACGTHTIGGGQCADCQKKQVNGKPLQTKLAISEPGDAYEQEADRVAEQVMRMPDPETHAKQNGNMSRPLVQRRATSGTSGLVEAPPIVHDALKLAGQPLDAATRSFFEPRFGQDFSHVRVHSGAAAEQSARDVSAHAYTVGHNIVFGPGRLSSDTHEGRQLLAHELTHVVQQGRASAASLAVQRLKSDEGPSTEFLQEAWSDVNELGIVYKEGTESEDGGVILRKAPGGERIRWLPQNTKVFILKEKKSKTNAYAVSVINTDGGSGEFGYVASTHVWRNLPDPDADVLKVKSGQSPIEIAFEHYEHKGFSKWGKDPRYVVNALVWVNQQARHNAKGESGISKEAVDESWYTAKSTAGAYIWLPGVDFMNAIYENVAEHGGGTGSITADLWRTVKKIGHWIAYGLAFVGGLLHGFLKSIWDAISGLVSTVADVLVSIFTGNVLSDAKELWETLKKITWEDIKEAMGTWADKWATKLNSSSPWTAGHAHGYLTGYIMAEAAQLLLTGGMLAAAKGALWTSRLGKVLKATRAMQAFEKGIEKAGKAGGKVKEAISAAATAIGKTKVFTVLAEARSWVGKVLLLSTETLEGLSLPAINRLRELSDDALARLKKFAEPVKRVVLGCASPCKVDLDVIRKYLDNLADFIGPRIAPVKGADEILAALPAQMDKSVLKAKLKKHPALVTAIEKAQLTPEDLAVFSKFMSPVELANGTNAYKTFVRTMSHLVPAKIGPDVKVLNEIAETIIKLEPKWGSAFKGPMFETFAKVHLGRFRNLTFSRAVWDNTRYTSLKKTRSSDGFIDSSGGLWDFKHTTAKVDADQADDYFKILTRGMESTEGQKAKSVNFLFATKEGAEANADLVKKGFDVFYVTPPDFVTKLK
jgi:hypothetical protein